MNSKKISHKIARNYLLSSEAEEKLRKLIQEIPGLLKEVSLQAISSGDPNTKHMLEMYLKYLETQFSQTIKKIKR
jgi:hypothetical protein